MKKLFLAGAFSLLFASAASAAPVMMSAEWAKGMCDAWNAEPILTGKLMESGWMKNDKGRGYKIMQIYRTECETSPRIEMKVVEKNGKAMCVYGGAVESKQLDLSADYLMWGTTQRWVEMGKGEYGPMKAMMFGRLRFDGPMGEAMGNMGPFESFLLLAGKVPGETASCPTAAAAPVAK